MANGDKTGNGTGWQILIDQGEDLIHKAQGQEIQCPTPIFPQTVLWLASVEVAKMKQRQVPAHDGKDGRDGRDGINTSTLVIGKAKAIGPWAIAGLVLIITMLANGSGKWIIDKLLGTDVKAAVTAVERPTP